MNNKYAKIEQMLGRVFISLIVFTLLAIAAEMSYRKFGLEKQTKNFSRLTLDINHVQKPYVMFTATPNTNITNSLGYLGDLPNKDKPKGEYRVFFLGGSALYFGKPNFVDILQEQLPKNVKIFNFGIPSSVARQELIRVLLDIAGYKPDLIVSYSGYNDLYDTGWDHRINYPHRYVLYMANPTLQPVEDYKLIPMLALASKFARDYFPYTLFKGLTEKVYPKNLPNRDDIRETIADAYIQNLRLTNVISLHLGARFISFFQPTLYFKNCYSDEERKYIDGFPMKRAYGVRDSVDKSYSKHKSEFTFYNMSELFKDDCRPAFFDFVHAHMGYPQEKIAKFVFPIISQEIKKGISVTKKPSYIPEEVFTQ